jgi:CheY-like chemotaxis protein
LTVARGTGSELGPCSLSAVVRGAVSLVEPTLPAGIKLLDEVSDELPPVLGDVGDLEQVLVNLMVNARDAIGERGTIKVVARTYDVGRGRGVAVMVEDDGPGIPPERYGEVFQPFVTSKPTGSGLGLAVARQILADHHGRIWLEERPGGGLRVLLALRHADAVDEAPAPMPEGREVLLVEDEPVLLEAQARALREAGYTVHDFTDATQAAAALPDSRPDILVTDVVMPGMNGFELASLCHERYPDVPILVVSAFVPDRQHASGVADGRWAQLHKPVREARLVATVGTLCRRAERTLRGDDDITNTSWLFPDLDALTADDLGLTS